MLRSTNDLRGFTLGATDGDIGTVEALYFDDESFTVRHLVVDTGGWLGGRRVLISPRAIHGVDWPGQRVRTDLTKSQVENSPDVDTAMPVSRQHELAYNEYYGYPSYWMGSYVWGSMPYPGPVAPPDFEGGRRREWRADLGDQHLRSSREVTGYSIQASDGAIGHVEDLLVDDGTWEIRYLVVDTRNWWPGKKVVLSPEWIEAIDWNDSTVRIGMTRDQIKNSPEYDPSRSIDREYEAHLFRYYDRPHYWSDRRDAA